MMKMTTNARKYFAILRGQSRSHQDSTAHAYPVISIPAAAIIAILLILAPSAHAQAVRFDSAAYTVSGQVPSGAMAPVLAIPGSTIAVCQDSACATRATTYTNAGAGTPCATLAPLTAATGGTVCNSLTDGQGNFGFYILPGAYYYRITLPPLAGGGSFTYPISVGASAGCPLGVTCDASYATLALGCAAAGSGTLYITRAWNSTPTIALCSTQFLSNGLISMATNAALTTATGATLSAPAAQQIFNVSASGSSAIPSAGSTAQLYPQWWGCKASTDCTTGFNAATAACAATGIPFVSPSGTYTLSGQWIFPATTSQGCDIGGPTYTVNSSGGATILSTLATGADFITPGSAPTFSTPHYRIHDLNLVGPDPGFPLTTHTSGNGISFDQANAVFVLEIERLKLSQWGGTGKQAIHVGNAETSIFRDIQVQNSTTCLSTDSSITTGTANMFINISCGQTTSDGVILGNSHPMIGDYNLQWIGSAIQAVGGWGIRIVGGQAISVTGVHFEDDVSPGGSILLDATNNSLENIAIRDNYFSGSMTNNSVSSLTPGAFTVQALHYANNYDPVSITLASGVANSDVDSCGGGTYTDNGTTNLFHCGPSWKSGGVAFKLDATTGQLVVSSGAVNVVGGLVQFGASQQWTAEYVGNNLLFFDGVNSVSVLQLFPGSGTSSIVRAAGNIIAPGLPASAGSGGKYACVDNAGQFYIKSSCP